MNRGGNKSSHLLTATADSLLPSVTDIISILHSMFTCPQTDCLPSEILVLTPLFSSRDGRQYYQYTDESGQLVTAEYDPSAYYDESGTYQYDASYPQDGADPSGHAVTSSDPAATSRTQGSLPNGPSAAASGEPAAYSADHTAYGSVGTSQSAEQSGPSEKQVGRSEAQTVPAERTAYSETPASYSDKQTGYSDPQTAYSDPQTAYSDPQTAAYSDSQTAAYSAAQTSTFSDTQAGYSDTQAGYSDSQTGYGDAQPTTGYSGQQPNYSENYDDYDQAAEYYDEETGDYFDGTAWSYYDEESGEWYYYDDGQTYNEDYNYAYDSSEQLAQTEKPTAPVVKSAASTTPATSTTLPRIATSGQQSQKKPDFGLGNLGLNKLTSSLGQIGQSVGQTVGQTVRSAGGGSTRPGSAASNQGSEQLAALGNKVGNKTKEVGSMFAGLLRGFGSDSRLAKTPAQSTPNLAQHPAAEAAAAAKAKANHQSGPQLRRQLTKHASLGGDDAASPTTLHSPSPPPSPPGSQVSSLPMPSDDAAILASIGRYRTNDPYMRRDEFYTSSDLEQDRALLDGKGVQPAPDGSGLIRRDSYHEQQRALAAGRPSIDRASPLYEEQTENTSSSPGTRADLSQTEPSYSPSPGTSPTRGSRGSQGSRGSRESRGSQGSQGSLSSPTLVKTEIDQDKLILGNFEPDVPPGRRSKVTTPVSPPRENVIEPHPAYQKPPTDDPSRAELRLADTEKKVSFEDEHEPAEPKKPMTARERWHWAYNKILLQLNVSTDHLCPGRCRRGWGGGGMGAVGGDVSVVWWTDLGAMS